MLLPPKHRRLWRRRLRRRPLLPFLLAATLALDLVLAVVLPGASAESRLSYVGMGVLIAQLALMADWCVYARRWVTQRALGAALLAFLIGWWFLATYPDSLVWLVYLYLLVFVAAAGGVQRLIPRVGIRRRSHGFGIAELLVATTIAVIAIASTRDAKGDEIVAVLSTPLVWSGVLADAGAFALTLFVIQRGWATSFVVLTTLLVNWAICSVRFYQLSIELVDFQTGSYTEILSEFVLGAIIYQHTFAATLLIWLLGLRSRGRATSPCATDTIGAAHEVSGAPTLDATV